MLPLPPRSPLFPYTTLFRSLGRWAAGPLGRWAARPLGRWAAGPLGRWAARPLGRWAAGPLGRWAARPLGRWAARPLGDRKSTRLNSSHSQISYAVFCLKKKKKSQLSTD